MSGDIQKVINKALVRQDRYVLRIRYRDAFDDCTERLVSPVRMVRGGKLLALCLGREEPRCFVIDRIESAELSEASQAMMPDEVKRR